MQLTPAQVAAIGKKNLANILAKVQSGRTLTAREQAIIDADAAGSEPTGVVWVLGYDALSAELGVSTRALKDWRGRPDLQPYLPKPKDNGNRHNVGEWRALMIRFGLKRADEFVESDDVTGERKTIRDWKEHREKLMCTQLERAIAKDDNQLLVATELEVPIGATFTVIQTRLSQFPERAARRVTGFTDVQEVEARLREELDGELTDFHAARWLDESLAELIASLPFDSETEQLFARVTFTGQDRAALLELIERVARQALGAIGQRVIAHSHSDTPGVAAIPTSHPDDIPDKAASPDPLATPAPAAKVHKSRTRRTYTKKSIDVGSKPKARRKLTRRRKR